MKKLAFKGSDLSVAKRAIENVLTENFKDLIEISEMKTFYYTSCRYLGSRSKRIAFKSSVSEKQILSLLGFLFSKGMLHLTTNNVVTRNLELEREIEGKREEVATFESEVDTLKQEKKIFMKNLSKVVREYGGFDKLPDSEKVIDFKIVSDGDVNEGSYVRYGTNMSFEVKFTPFDPNFTPERDRETTVRFNGGIIPVTHGSFMLCGNQHGENTLEVTYGGRSKHLKFFVGSDPDQDHNQHFNEERNPPGPSYVEPTMGNHNQGNRNEGGGMFTIANEIPKPSGYDDHREQEVVQKEMQIVVTGKKISRIEELIRDNLKKEGIKSEVMFVEKFKIINSKENKYVFDQTPDVFLYLGDKGSLAPMTDNSDTQMSLRLMAENSTTNSCIFIHTFHITQKRAVENTLKKGKKWKKIHEMDNYDKRFKSGIFLGRGKKEKLNYFLFPVDHIKAGKETVVKVKDAVFLDQMKELSKCIKKTYEVL